MSILSATIGVIDTLQVSRVRDGRRGETLDKEPERPIARTLITIVVETFPGTAAVIGRVLDVDYGAVYVDCHPPDRAGVTLQDVIEAIEAERGARILGAGRPNART